MPIQIGDHSPVSPIISSRLCTRGITFSGLTASSGILVVAQLVVDAPDVVGLLVDQHGRARVARRVELGQPLGRPVAVEHDVDDHVAAFVAGALQAAGRAPRARSCARRRRPPPSRRQARSRRPASTRASRTPSVRASIAGDAGLPADVDQVGSAPRARSSRICSMLYCARLTIGGSFWFSSCGILKCSTSVSR